MNTHISKDLALWLKERGCRVECSRVWATYTPASGGEPFDLVVGYGDDTFLWSESLPPAYTFYDIIVTYAKEFWGEEKMFCHEAYKGVFHRSGCQAMDCSVNATIKGYLFHPQWIIDLLQQNKIQEAEDYIKKHSVFNKELK